jgi:hypothetical protein
VFTFPSPQGEEEPEEEVRRETPNRSSDLIFS